MASTNAEITPDTRPGKPSKTTAALWGGPFLLGLLSAVLGIVLLGCTATASFASVFAVGILLAAGGISEIVAAFRARKTGGPFWLFFLAGILTTVVGVLFLMYPGAGLGTLTLLLAGYFFASGLFNLITSVMDRYPQWGWDCAYGIVAIFLGISVMAQWPASSLWLVGTLVGLGLLMRGIATMSAAFAIRRGIRQIEARGTV